MLADIAAGRRQLTHGELDDLEQTPILAHLRSVLVATGTLPPRDEQMARLERFVSDTLATRIDPDQRQILHRYAIWHLLRRLRSRNNGQAATIQQYAVVHQHVRAAVVLLDWLTAQHLSLATCRQADLERWLAGSEASHRYHAGHFVRWATRNRLATLSFPATRWHGPMRALDEQARWDAARRLLHDDTLNARDRLAGLLVLLYAQPVARISRLTTGHVTIDGTTVRIRLGPAPITLPGPVADLTRQLLDGKRGHATTGAGNPSPWLFPGGQPGRPISATHLGQRLKDLGIQPGQARSDRPVPARHRAARRPARPHARHPHRRRRRLAARLRRRLDGLRRRRQPPPAGRLIPMAELPELDIARVRRWCEERVPAHARDQVRVEYDIGPRQLTIVECRPPWREGIGPEWTRFPIARLRYTQATRTWTLYWRDRNLRFHRYGQLEPSPHIDDLLTEIDRDPIAIFWG